SHHPCDLRTYPNEREGHSPRTLERRSGRRPRTLPDQSGRYPDLRRHLHARRPPLHHRWNGAREFAPAGAVLSINRISRQGWKENPVRWYLCRRVPYTKTCPITPPAKEWSAFPSSQRASTYLSDLARRGIVKSDKSPSQIRNPKFQIGRIV